jgi:hypothetical protein
LAQPPLPSTGVTESGIGTLAAAWVSAEASCSAFADPRARLFGLASCDPAANPVGGRASGHEHIPGVVIDLAGDHEEARRSECEATAALTLLPSQELAEMGVAHVLLASSPLLAGWRPVWFGRRCSPAKGRGVVDQSLGSASNHRPGVIYAMK